MLVWKNIWIKMCVLFIREHYRRPFEYIRRLGHQLHAHKNAMKMIYYNFYFYEMTKDFPRHIYNTLTYTSLIPNRSR